MKVTNKKFAHEFLTMTKKVFTNLSEIDTKEAATKHELERAQAQVNTIKQANNIFRSCLQHDVASAKIEGYRSTFLDEEE